MKQQMGRKFIHTALNPSEMTLTLDQLESNVAGEESVLVLLHNNAQIKMLSTPACECGVIRSNRLPS